MSSIIDLVHKACGEAVNNILDFQDDMYKAIYTLKIAGYSESDAKISIQGYIDQVRELEPTELRPEYALKAMERVLITEARKVFPEINLEVDSK